MKVLYIHNDYHQWSGEENASQEIANLLQVHGHEVLWFKRTSKGLEKDRLKKVTALFSGVYNFAIRSKLNEVLKAYNPDIAIVQNIYPLISSSIFGILRRNNIPVVMRCPNYRLFCPNGLCLNPQGEVCERCMGKGHEWHCVWNNCEMSIPKSVGYAVRNAFNRITGLIYKGVDCFVVQSEFQKEKFMVQGIPESQIGILSGILPQVESMTDVPLGDWVSFVGRVSKEKGIDEFIEAAKMLPTIPFKVVGKIDENYRMPEMPSNIELVGFKQGHELNEMFQMSRIVVVPSKWYEGFPNVILHAMLMKRPVVTTNIGAMTSIVDDKVNGLLVEPGDTLGLKDAIASLYGDREMCAKLGSSGYEKAIKEYSRESIYHDLMGIFQQAIKNHQMRN